VGFPIRHGYRLPHLRRLLESLPSLRVKLDLVILNTYRSNYGQTFNLERKDVRGSTPVIHYFDATETWLHSRGKTELQTLVATMRRLLHVIFDMLKHDQPFDGAKVYAPTNADLAPISADSEVA
jgi:hypothetical protein